MRRVLTVVAGVLAVAAVTAGLAVPSRVRPSLSHVMPDVDSPAVQIVRPHQANPPGAMWSDNDLLMADDFEGTSLDTGRWQVYDTPGGAPPRTPRAVTVADGELRITGGFDPVVGKDISGGLASTLDKLYGRWEARVRAEPGSGYSAVVLLWPQSERWPRDGEIDVIEANAADRQSAYNFLHNGAEDAQVGHRVDADFTQWHTVGVAWTPSKITFYLDGGVSYVETRPAYIPTTSPMHLTLQFDIGCNEWYGCRNAQTPSQVVYHVDWVRAYALA